MGKLRVPYHRLIFVFYMLALISFFFLGCQEISSQELAACMTFLTIPVFGKILRSKATYKKEVFVFLIYITVEICVSLARYGQSINAVLYYIANIFSMLLYVYFASFANDSSWYYKIFKKFGKLALFLLYLATITYYIGFQFLDFTLYRMRDGSLRLTCAMMLTAFFCIVTFSEFLNSNKSKKSLSNYLLIVLGLGAVIFIVQTRMNMLGIGVAIACMLAFCIKNPSKKILIIAGVIVMAVLLLQLPSVGGYLTNKFAGVFNFTDNAMIPRAGAIPHYIEMAKDNKLFGIGIISPSQPSNGKFDLMYIMHGEWRVYSYDDVGVFSYYMMYGIIGVVMYAYMFLKLFKRAWRERYTTPYKLGLVVYVFVTGFSMIITDLWRQSNIALFLLLMDLQLEAREESKFEG